LLPWLPIKLPDLFKDPSKFFNDLLQDIIRKIVEEPTAWMLKTLVDNFKNQHTLQYELIEVSRNAAVVLVTIFFIIRILNGMKENITGEQNVNFAEIAGSYLISYVFIFATPYIVTNFLMKISSQLLLDLPYLVFKGQLSLDDIDPDKGFFGLIPSDKLLKYGPWLITFIMIVLFIALIAFTLSAAVLNVELSLLLLLGPLLATTFQNRSQVFRTYWTECVAVVFTRNIQLFIFLNLIGCLSKFQLLYAFGLFIVGIRGPQILRQFLHGQSSVPGLGVVGGAAQFAAYRMMFKAIGK
jgi:hypothetical protein